MKFHCVVLIAQCALAIGLSGCVQGSRSTAHVAKAAPLPGAKNVHVAWNASPSAGLVGYNIYAGTNPRQYVVATPAAGTNGVVTGLSPGTWYFAVTATNSAGLESPFSNEVSYTITEPQQWVRVTILRSTNMQDWVPVLTAPPEPVVFDLNRAFYRAAITNWIE